MNDLTGFFLNPFNQNGGPHGKVVSWYAKTVDINLDQIDVDGRFSNQSGTYTPNTAIYDRLGESDIASLLGSATAAFPWFNREGSGQGWSYSVLGGGKAARPVSTVARVPVSWDNTLQVRSRGDFAVPTLFDGNFDAEFEQPLGSLSINPSDSSLQRNTISNAITGWSFRNNATGATWESNVVKNGDLKDWKDIPTFADSNGYLSKLGIDPTAANYQPNYAIELNSSRNTITHNRFLVPDWGALRFDLFTGAINSSNNGKLKVFLDALDGSSATEIYEVLLQKAEGTSTSYGADTHKIGYGETGFETFTTNSIPDSWRGKVGTLRFELDDSTQPVYLDNIFFKSQHLLLGNPTEARKPDVVGAATSRQPYDTNYLIEKPQYAVSYNDETKTPNWVSWEVDGSWLGNTSRTGFEFKEDSQLPASWYETSDADYSGQTFTENGRSRSWEQGHMTPANDRNRNEKDLRSTFLGTNVIAQHPSNNRGLWAKFEKFANDLAKTKGKYIYVTAGSFGINNALTPTIPTADGQSTITVPETLWKVVVILDNPNQSLTDIFQQTPNSTVNDRVIAIRVPNANTAGGSYSPSWWDPNYQISVRDLETQLFQATGQRYNFLSNLPQNVQDRYETSIYSGNVEVSAFLQAETSNNGLDELGNNLISDRTIWHDSVVKNSIIQNEWLPLIRSISENGISQVSLTEIGKFNLVGINQIGSSQVGSDELSTTQKSPVQVGSTQIGILETSLLQTSTTQVSSTQVSPTPILLGKIGVNKDGTLQIGSSDLTYSRQNTITKVSVPSSVTFQQLFITHLDASHSPNLQNTTVPTWTEFLQSPTPFNLKIDITDLPTGQLAEATITGYDTNNRPNSGTLTLDTDGNSLGWFIDTTPDDNSEFDQNLTTTAFLATTGAAAGKYDLLTTVLHELGHLQGIISGNTAFDTHVQNINGIPTFINGGLTAKLTPDGSHLDSTLYPYDLMNTSLKPGVRKLPSALDLAILNTLWSNKPTTSQQLSTTANLTAGALRGITNGDFTTPNTWNTEGATNIINGTATLTEQSQKLSELTQAFIIPTGAKTLQFTIIDNHLITGDTTKTANDAFEVALLDTNTFNPLAGTSIGLNRTDSLLNIQANGTIHKSDKVTITALTNNSSIVTIDLTQITPTTQATLYFNLLG
jgi:DNA/RNA endonuclease G (NUC1)